MPASSTLTKVPAFDPRQSPTVLAHTTQPATRRAWTSPTEPRARRCLLPPEYRTQSPARGACFLPLVPPTSTRLRTPSATADASLLARVLRPAPSPPARRHRMSLRRILACPSPAPVGAPFRPPPASKRRPVVRRTVTLLGNQGCSLKGNFRLILIIGKNQQEIGARSGPGVGSADRGQRDQQQGESREHGLFTSLPTRSCPEPFRCLARFPSVRTADCRRSCSPARR